MTEQAMALLCRGLEQLGLPWTQGAAEQLSLYGDRLLEKNQVMNLTAITDPEEVVKRHFLDSAALLPSKALGGRKVIDVGTGAGFPGLVLEVARTPPSSSPSWTAWGNGWTGWGNCARNCTPPT